MPCCKGRQRRPARAPHTRAGGGSTGRGEPDRQDKAASCCETETAGDRRGRDHITAAAGSSGTAADSGTGVAGRSASGNSATSQPDRRVVIDDLTTEFANPQDTQLDAIRQRVAVEHVNRTAKSDVGR